MLRTRMLWFTMGFSATATAVAHLVWRDLWTERHALSADTKQKFDALEARVVNLESNLGQPKRGLVGLVNKLRTAIEIVYKVEG